MKKITKISFFKVKDGLTEVFPLSAPEEKKGWKDGNPTDAFETIAFDVAIKDVGLCQVIFPYRPNLAESLNDQITFGLPLDLNSIGTISDIHVGMYNNSLTVKIQMEELI